jgi:hypothetical protein
MWCLSHAYVFTVVDFEFYRGAFFGSFAACPNSKTSCLANTSHKTSAVLVAKLVLSWDLCHIVAFQQHPHTRCQMVSVLQYPGIACDDVQA